MASEESKQEPLEGLHIVDYDAATEKVTIELHGSLLRTPLMPTQTKWKYCSIDSRAP